MSHQDVPRAQIPQGDMTCIQMQHQIDQLQSNFFNDAHWKWMVHSTINREPQLSQMTVARSIP